MECSSDNCVKFHLPFSSIHCHHLHAKLYQRELFLLEVNNRETMAAIGLNNDTLSLKSNGKVPAEMAYFLVINIH